MFLGTSQKSPRQEGMGSLEFPCPLFGGIMQKSTSHAPEIRITFLAKSVKNGKSRQRVLSRGLCVQLLHKGMDVDAGCDAFHAIQFSQLFAFGGIGIAAEHGKKS